MRLTITTEYWEVVKTAPAPRMREIFDLLTREEAKMNRGETGMKVTIRGAGCKGGKHWHVPSAAIRTLEEELQELEGAI